MSPCVMAGSRWAYQYSVLTNAQIVRVDVIAHFYFSSVSYPSRPHELFKVRRAKYVHVFFRHVAQNKSNNADKLRRAGKLHQLHAQPD